MIIKVKRCGDCPFYAADSMDGSAYCSIDYKNKIAVYNYNETLPPNCPLRNEDVIVIAKQIKGASE